MMPTDDAPESLAAVLAELRQLRSRLDAIAPPSPPSSEPAAPTPTVPPGEAWRLAPNPFIAKLRMDLERERQAKVQEIEDRRARLQRARDEGRL
jgi:hypothetical protein